MYRLFPETCDEQKAKEISMNVEEVNLKLPKLLHSHTLEFEHGGSKNNKGNSNNNHNSNNALKGGELTVLLGNHSSELENLSNEMEVDSNQRAMLEKKTVSELREMLRGGNQKVSGKKSELIDRLCGTKRKLEGNSQTKGQPSTKKQKVSKKKEEPQLDVDEDDYRNDNSYDGMDHTGGGGLGFGALIGSSDLSLGSHPKCSFCHREEMKCIDLPCFKRKLNLNIDKTYNGKCTACDQSMSLDQLDRHFRMNLSENSINDQQPTSNSIEEPNNPTVPNLNLDSNPTTVFLIKVSGLCYWSFLSVPAQSKLKDLDDWVRSNWMECCGHLSSIRVLPSSPTSNDLNLSSLNNNLSSSTNILNSINSSGSNLNTNNNNTNNTNNINNINNNNLNNSVPNPLLSSMGGGGGLSPMMSFPSPSNFNFTTSPLPNSLNSSLNQIPLLSSNNLNSTLLSESNTNVNNLSNNNNNNAVNNNGVVQNNSIEEDMMYWSTTMKRGGTSGGWARKSDMKDVEIGTFGVGTAMEYCYHLGSATPSFLRIQLLRCKTDKVSHFCPKKEPDVGDFNGQIELLAMNEPPEVPCAEYGCKGRAVYVCTVCDKWKDFFCNEHGRAHVHRGNMGLVANSPRIGICKYKSCGF